MVTRNGFFLYCKVRNFENKTRFMNKFQIPLLLVSILLALYEQSKEKPNMYVMIASILVFMYCMMRLGSKIPSKNQDKEDDDVQ